MLTMPRSVQGWCNTTKQPSVPWHIRLGELTCVGLTAHGHTDLTDISPLNADAQVFSQLVSLWKATAVTHVVRRNDPLCPHINMLLWIKYWSCLWRHDLRLAVCRRLSLFPPIYCHHHRLNFCITLGTECECLKKKKKKKLLFMLWTDSARATVFSF